MCCTDRQSGELWVTRLRKCPFCSQTIWCENCVPQNNKGSQNIFIQCIALFLDDTNSSVTNTVFSWCVLPLYLVMIKFSLAVGSRSLVSICIKSVTQQLLPLVKLQCAEIPKMFFTPHHRPWLQHGDHWLYKCNSCVQGHCFSNVISDHCWYSDLHLWC
jgi:hypothetical protein